jgi:DNA-binding LacI/PurR family transcriptional regulator
LLRSTIYDIAKAAGVTGTTVSYVLSGKGSISEATRARVLKYAQELGYRPNLIARSLIKQRTCTIGLVMPRISNPFYAEVAEAVERLAYASGFRVFITNTHENEQLGGDLLEDLMARRVDGIIYLPHGLPLYGIQATLASGIPIVFCIWEEEEPEVSPCIGFDFMEGGRLAAEHLLALGHQRVAIVTDGPSVDRIKHHLRVAGAKSALMQAGHPLDPALLCLGDSSVEKGEAAAHELLTLPEPPTAIFATNDLMAIGIITAAWKLGIHIPRDLSVVGFDDIVLAAYIAPPLTTIVMDKSALTERAMNILFSMIEGKQVTSPPLLLPRLVIRGSTTQCPKEYRA